MEDLLKKLYYDTKTGFVSADKLYKKAKELDPKITHKIVKEFIKRQATAQINKEVKKSRKTIYNPITGPIGHYQLDLTDFPKYSNKNNGYRYILCMVEVNTKKAYVKPIKKKTQKEVSNALEELINEIKNDKHKITIIQSDSGKEFKNNFVKKLLDKEVIEQRFSVVGDKKAMGVVERFNRTLRNLITKYLVANNTTKWIDKLHDFVSNYNSTFHSSVKDIPNNIDEKKEIDIIVEKNNQLVEQTGNQPSVAVGDKVRLKLDKGTFKKLGRNYSVEVYEVVKVNKNTLRLDGIDKLVKISNIQVIPKETEIIDNSKITKQEKKYKIKRAIRRELGTQ